MRALVVRTRAGLPISTHEIEAYASSVPFVVDRELRAARHRAVIASDRGGPFHMASCRIPLLCLLGFLLAVASPAIAADDDSGIYYQLGLVVCTELPAISSLTLCILYCYQYS